MRERIGVGICLIDEASERVLDSEAFGYGLVIVVASLFGFVFGVQVIC